MMMSRFTWPTLAALCLSGAASFSAPTVASEGTPGSSGGLTIPLEYHETGYPVHNFSLQVTAQTVPFAKEPSLPKSLRRGKLNLPGFKETSMGFIWTPDKLYLDLNSNGDLTDDPSGVYTNRSGSTSWSGNYHYGYFDKVKLNFSFEQGEAPWVAGLNFSDYGQRGGPNVFASTYCYWSGTGTVNGTKVELGWIPLDRKGVLGTTQDYMLLRDAAGPQNSFSTSDGSLRTFNFPKKLFFNGALYNVGINSEKQGQNLKFTLGLSEEKIALGELKVAGKFVQRLLLADGPCVAVVDAPKELVRVPLGHYAMATVQVGTGSKFVYPKQPLRRSIDISAAGAAELIAGGPLTNSISITRNDSILQLSYELVGAGGIQYNEWDRQTPPRFLVYKNGTQIDAGNFEYG